MMADSLTPIASASVSGAMTICSRADISCGPESSSAAASASAVAMLSHAEKHEFGARTARLSAHSAPHGGGGGGGGHLPPPGLKPTTPLRFFRPSGVLGALAAFSSAKRPLTCALLPLSRSAKTRSVWARLPLPPSPRLGRLLQRASRALPACHHSFLARCPLPALCSHAHRPPTAFPDVLDFWRAPRVSSSDSAAPHAFGMNRSPPEPSPASL